MTNEHLFRVADTTQELNRLIVAHDELEAAKKTAIVREWSDHRGMTLEEGLDVIADLRTLEEVNTFFQYEMHIRRLL
jgi:hypothetical protein